MRRENGNMLITFGEVGEEAGNNEHKLHIGVSCSVGFLPYQEEMEGREETTSPSHEQVQSNDPSNEKE